MTALAEGKLSYSVEEAVAATGLSLSYLSGAIRNGKLKAKATTARKKDAARSGKRVILTAELQRFLDEMPDA